MTSILDEARAIVAACQFDTPEPAAPTLAAAPAQTPGTNATSDEDWPPRPVGAAGPAGAVRVGVPASAPVHKDFDATGEMSAAGRAAFNRADWWALAGLACGLVWGAAIFGFGVWAGWW